MPDTDLNKSIEAVPVVPVGGCPASPPPILNMPFALGIACLVVIGVNLRPGIVSIGPLLPSIKESFALSHAGASLLVSIPDVLMGILALPTPWLARRYGRDRVILASLILLLVSTICRAFAGSVVQLLASTAAVGAGLAIAGALVGGFIKAAYPTRVALVMGVYAAALSFGSAVAAAASGWLAQLMGSWRFGCGIWAIPCLFAIIAWLFIEIYQRRQHPQGLSSARPHRLPLSNPRAWLIALFFGCDNFLFYGLVSGIAPLYHEHGLNETEAGLILASFPAVFVIASPIIGLLSRRTDRRPALALLSAMAVLGLIALAVVPFTLPFLIIPLIAFGVAGGFTLGMALPLDNTSDADEANLWNAFIITVAYLIAATGSLLVGALRDITGNFQSSLWLLVAVGSVMLFITPFLRPKSLAHPRA